MGQLEELEAKLGVTFRQRGLLELALVHSSYINEFPGIVPESNERLEFLGDALLGLVMAHELYQRYPGRSEGELTSLRSALVQDEALARAARSLDLGRHLVMGRGEEASGGRERPSNLSGAFEALVGALLLDQGYEPARAFVLRALGREIAEVGQRGALQNPKSALQEALQGRKQPPPSYRIVEVSGKDHARTFTAEVLVSGQVMGRGTGRRKIDAEQEAAREALKALGYVLT